MNDNHGVNAINIGTSVQIGTAEGSITINTLGTTPQAIDINWREVCQNALAQRKKLSTNPLTTGDGIEFTLDDIYVPLGLVEKVTKEKRPGDISPEEGSKFYQPEKLEQHQQKKEYEEVTRTYKNDEFFAQVLKLGESPKSQGRRLAVTGEAGAGKTTLLQKIALWVAEKTEQDVAIWVSLADLQGQSIEEYLLQKWLKDTLKMRVTPEMEDALALLFKSGRVWLLLDGVDEIGAANPLTTVAEQIKGWVVDARVVVTCRQNVWDAGKNALEGFDVYRNLDFDYPEGVGRFIHSWFARQQELRKRLLAELAQPAKERIRDMVRNPLRLALLCRAWQIRQGDLPETKAALYGEFTKAFYEWKRDKEFPITEDEEEELNTALCKLALRGMEQSESRFRLKEGLVREILGKKDKPPFSLALKLGWLNRVGVAVENPDEEVFAFYHPTFQEYFAALVVEDWKYFLDHIPNPRRGTYLIFEPQWKEVILLWFGRENVHRDKKEAFIEKLINFDDGCGSWNYRKVDKGFYEYRAYFLAGAILPEFKDSRFAKEIVNQIIKWRHNCFLQEIEEGANTVLVESDRQKVTARLIQMWDETFDEYDLRRIGDILSNIAVGDEEAMTRLILLLERYSDFLTGGSIAESLGKIAVGNEGVIARLIQLLYEPSDKYTRIIAADILGKIAVGNEGAVTHLIEVLDKTSDDHTRIIIADILGKIALKNREATARLIQILTDNLDRYTCMIAAQSLYSISIVNEDVTALLIQLLDEKHTVYTRRIVAYILANIAVQNEQATARLIQLLDESSDQYTCRIVARGLGNVGVGNEAATARLIQLLNETSDYHTLWIVAESLGNIAVGNEEAIFRLMQLFNETYDYHTCWIVAKSLGKIAVGNEELTAQLMQMLAKTSNEYTRRNVADILGNIAVGDEGVTSRLIQLLDETSDEDTYRKVAKSLVNITVGNEGDIDSLIKLLDETSDEFTRMKVADRLGKIAVGNEKATERLILILDKTSDYHTRWIVAENLSKIAVGNDRAVTRLIQLFNKTSYEYTCSIFGNSLRKIIVKKEQYFQLIYDVKHNLSHNSYYNKKNKFNISYELIWQCAQNLSYPDFYREWHQNRVWQKLGQYLNRPIF